MEPASPLGRGRRQVMRRSTTPAITGTLRRMVSPSRRAICISTNELGSDSTRDRAVARSALRRASPTSRGSARPGTRSCSGADVPIHTYSIILAVANVTTVPLCSLRLFADPSPRTSDRSRSRARPVLVPHNPTTALVGGLLRALWIREGARVIVVPTSPMPVRVRRGARAR